MTAEYALDGLHPSYGRVVEDVIEGLLADYPECDLSLVRTRRSPGDLSRCDASTPGVISLNLAWFGEPMSVLVDAAARPQVVELRDGATALWHGGMPEPLHLLTHEFGHQLQNALLWWRSFAAPHWRGCCADPVHRPPVSGYSLGDEDEFFADVFAAMRLRVDCELTRLLAERFEA